MKIDRMKVAASKVVLGLLHPEQFANIAALALRDGCDSASLRVLAGSSAGDAEEARTLFERALAEMHIDVPSKLVAVRHLARNIANEFLCGAMSPDACAKQIWELCLRIPMENVPELDAFVYAASEWDDRPEDRQVFENGITAAARDLVSIPYGSKAQPSPSTTDCGASNPNLRSIATPPKPDG